MSIFDKKQDKNKHFQKVIENASNEEKRIAEEAFLKPENVPPYTGELPKNSNELASRTVLIVFRDQQQMDLVGTLFSIRESCNGNAYITDIQLLENIAKEVQDGILYVKDGIIYVNKQYESSVDDVEPTATPRPMLNLKGSVS